MEIEGTSARNILKGLEAKLAAILLALIYWVAPAAAQGPPPPLDTEQEGIETGNYNVKQSIEFGYRFTDISGNKQTYDTFVNLQPGFRLLDFSTEMHSLDHHGTLFDNLFFSNFGYGGDPNQVSRLRISKNKWYDFDAFVRKNQNFWDYSLLANPLNPVAPPFANAPAGFTPIISNSPHLFSTRLQLQDYNLLILPTSRIRFRLGYDRSTNDGPGLSSIHQGSGTDYQLTQDYRNVMNTYRLGVDFRMLPKTNISYDQYLSYYKNDTGSTDQNFPFTVSNGTPVDIGISLNAGASQPCSGTFVVGGFVNPVCNAYSSFLRHAQTRTSNPTEQLSIQSSYFHNWEISARASYTSGGMRVNNWFEDWTGRAAKPNQSSQNANGDAFGERVAATADFGATWRITNKLRFIDSFHFGSFHNPAEFDSANCLFFSPSLLLSANVFAPTTAVPCAPPADGVAGIPVHTTSSGPDFSLPMSSLFLKQEMINNLSEFQYQFSPRLGVRVGFRYTHRSINTKDFESTTEVFFPDNANRGDCALVNGALPNGCTSNGDGSFTFVTPQPNEIDASQTLINEYSGLFGIWARPLDNWRMSFDMELLSADNAFTRISPRQAQEYRFRTTYKPKQSINVSGSISIWESRNNVTEINNLQHNRFYGASTSFQPKDWLGFELGYDYNDVYSQILICYTSSVAPPGLNQCPGSTLLQQLSVYRNNSHFGYFDTTLTLWKRLTARVGGSFTGTNGSALILAPTAPTGPLDSLYLQPFAGLDFQFSKRWTGKTYWGFYDYHEDSDNVPQDIFAPRNFRGNLVTLSVRYAF